MELQGHPGVPNGILIHPLTPLPLITTYIGIPAEVTELGRVLRKKAEDWDDQKEIKFLLKRPQYWEDWNF